MSLNYADIFIDYIEQFTDKSVIDTFSGSLNMSGESAPYKPLRPLNNIAFSNDNIDTITEINKNIVGKNINQIVLSKEDVYSLMSTLSVDDLSLFSPKIEIWRRLPSYVVTDAASDSSTKDESYVYKKFDFVDGWNRISPSGRKPNADEIQNNLFASNAIVGDFNESILNGSTGYGVAAILDASWELHGSSTGLQGGPEIYDYLNKIGASISKFNITFKFDSVATFFGNAQGNGQELITNFLKSPKTYIQEMSDRGIEGNVVTRNYSYLMFFGDITEENNKAELNNDNSQEAYRFLIKVGYEPIDYPIDSIITDGERKQRIIKFNNLLKQYPDYFNLIFKSHLSEYAFEFGIDNSITLKCTFGGNVQQGSINELLSYKRKDFNFLKILEDLAIESEIVASSSDPNALLKKQEEINEAKKIIENNQQLINEYEILSRAGCRPEITKNSSFKESLQKELEESLNKINSIKEKSWSYFLDNVPVHMVQMPENNVVWSNSVLNDEPISYEVDSNFLKKALRINTINDSKIQRQEINPQALKDAANSSGNTAPSAIVGSESENIIYTPFFFFGDLVNEILQKFKDYHKKQGKNDYNDLICTMPNITIYKRSLKTDLGIFLFNGPSRIEHINCGYVPISLSLFRAWVYRNIVVKQREYYYFFDLLNDLKKLITESINYKTSEIISKEPVLKSLNGNPLTYGTFYNTTFTVNENTQFDGFFQKALSSPRNTPDTNNQSIFQTLYILDSYSKPYKNYLICGYTQETLYKTSQILNEIYTTKTQDGEQSVNKLTSAGDYSIDIKNGIVHFYIGNQLGLAKNFSFKAGPAPKQIEIQSSQETRTTDNIRNIRYDDVEIKLVGGNFFRPTELIYVHPHYAFGEPFEKTLTMSNILNIGGYYSILSINSTFTKEGRYETTLTAKYLVQAHDAANRDKCENIISPLLEAKYASFTGQEQAKLASQGVGVGGGVSPVQQARFRR